MSPSNRYICVAKLEGVDLTFLWESGGDQPDRVVLDEEGFVLTFSSTSNAAVTPGVLQEAGVTVYDLDAIQLWCESRSEVVDSVPLLNVWNLLNDLPKIGELYAAADARTDDIYDKLFKACNLPSLTTGRAIEVEWQSAEVTALKRLLLLGLAELRARFRKC